MANTRTLHERTSPLVWIGAAVMVGVVAARCLIAISGEPVFDLDPLQDPLPWFGIGPAGVLISSVVMLVGASFVLLGERFSGRGLDRMLLLLALIPVIAVVLHGMSDAGDFWRGMDWVSAAIGAVAFAHAVRNLQLRAAILGALLGVLAMIAVRGALQIFLEHGETIAYFDAHREVVLRSFGWDPESVQANLYERRLRQPEATGWFGLANIFSALMAIGFVLLVGCLGRGRRFIQSGSVLLLIIVAIGFGLLVTVNGSKGAYAALVLGILVVLMPLVSRSWRERSRTLPGILALAALALAIAAVVFRGLAFNEDALGGERSLLFRWHYLVGAARMLAAYPWLGVGPNGFQEAYLFFKPPMSPEDPTSAHDVLVDWVATLGIFGAAWIGLLTVLALRIGRGIAGSQVSREERGAFQDLSALFPIAIIVAGLWGIWMELGALTEGALIFRVVAIVLAIAVSLVGRQLLFRMDAHILGWCLGGAAATLLALGGIDMLFTQPGSVAIAWAFLGAFSCARDRTRGSGDISIACVPILLAVWLVITGAYPQLVVGSRMEQAAEGLRSLGRLSIMSQDVPGGLAPQSRADALAEVRADATSAFSELPPEHSLRKELDVIDWDTLAPGSNDARLIRAHLIRRLAPSARRKAIDQLLESVDAYPHNFAPAWASVEQLRLLAAMGDETEASVALLEALVRMDELVIRNPGARSAITAAWVLSESADVEDDPDQIAVMAAFEKALEYSPYDPTLWIGLADVAREVGDRDRERAALIRALEHDEDRRLDPLVQFTPQERDQLNARLMEGTDQPLE